MIRRPTINDVARAAGVSKRTVSRVINGSDKVNVKTRERIESLIREMGFRPNRQARGLAMRRSYLLGLVYDVPTRFIADMQGGVLDVCRDSGFELLVHACASHGPQGIDEILQFVERVHLDGLVVMPPFSQSNRLIDGLERTGIPFIELTSEVSERPWRQVVTDYAPAISAMTEHLFELGHRRFGFVSGPADNLSSRKRGEAFAQALAAYGLTLRPEWIAEGAFTFESGAAAARKMLGRTDRPTAIFAANDEMALAVIRVANDMGLAVPGDLSVVGFDGTPFSAFVTPTLTTIVRNTHEMAELAAHKLIDLIEQGEDAARRHATRVTPTFLARESTGPAPAP
ncbi:MAG: LacI family DNA-binding transcriptional regulator [Xanthomonadales bacterium]